MENRIETVSAVNIGYLFFELGGGGGRKADVILIKILDEFIF